MAVKSECKRVKQKKTEEPHETERVGDTDSEIGKQKKDRQRRVVKQRDKESSREILQKLWLICLIEMWRT